MLFGYFANIATPESIETEFEFADVSILELDDWVAISTPAPMPVEEPAQLSSADVLDQEVPAPAIPISEPVVTAPGTPRSASLPTVAPAVPARPEFAVLSTPEPPSRMQSPEVVPPPPEPEEAPEVEVPAEQAAPKISSEAASEPEPDAVQDDEVKVATSPDESTEPTQEETDESTAPEQAATKIVTEADEAEEPRASPPIRRPTYIASLADSADEPEAEPLPDDADDPPSVSTADQAEIDSLIAQSQLEQFESAEERESTAEPLIALSDEGALIPSGISEGLRRAIRDCWNLGALSTAGMRTVLTIGFSLISMGDSETKRSSWSMRNPSPKSRQAGRSRRRGGR